MRTRIPTLVSLALLVLAPLVFYWSMVVRDLEPVNVDTRAHKPIGAWALEAQEEEGRLPEWFPYIFSGMPSYGSFLYIPRPGSNLLGQSLQLFSSSRGARYALLFMVGGIAAFLFYRRQRFSRVAATTAALAYSMTPYFTGLVAAGHSTKLEALAVAPLVLLAVDLLLDRPGPWTAALLAYATALLAWANHPQILYYLAMVVGLYVLGRWGVEARRDWISSHGIRILVYGAIAAVVAAALVTIPYLGIQEYTPYSIRGAASALSANPGETGVGWDYATAWSYPPGELLAFLFPAWFGLAGATYWGHLPFTQSTHYVGILVLLLAFLGAWKGEGRRRWIWLGLSFTLLLIGFGNNFAPLYRALYGLLPLFDRFRVPSMIYALLPLTLGYLVCAGLDFVRALLDRQAVLLPTPRGRAGGSGGEAAGARGGKGGGGRGTRSTGSGPAWSPLASRGLLAFGIVLALWAIVAVAVRGAHSGADSLLRPQDATTYGSQVLPLLQADRMDLLMGSLTHAFLLLALSALVVFLAGLLSRRPLSTGRIGTWAAVALGVLAVGDLWRIDREFYSPEPTETAEELVPHPGATAFLARQPGPFRVFPLQPLFSSNSFVTAGLESVGGYQPAKLRVYQDLIDAGVLTAPGVLRMLDVQYLLASSPVETGSPPLYDDDGYVYALPPTPGRVWAVSRVETMPDAASLLARLGERTFAPEELALVYDVDPRPGRSEYEPAQVELVERGLHRIRAQVEASGPAFVVFGEIHYAPGWRATVDGVDAPIVRVDHVLRGVEVPAGSHGIEMVYRSRAHDRAEVANRAGLVALGVLLVLGAVLRRRQARSSSSMIQ